MKNFTKTLCAMLAMIIALASCSKSDDFSKLAEEQRIKDSIENERIQNILKTPQLKSFALKNFTNPKLDTAKGIWYDLITEGEDASYSYQFQSNGALVFPTAVTKYKVTLLNGENQGTLVDESKDGTPATFTLDRVIAAWQIAFFPKKMAFQGKEVNVGGLTIKGLKKGSKIKIVAPSYFGYDQTVKDKVPANSPLYSEIEVVSISN